MPQNSTSPTGSSTPHGTSDGRNATASDASSKLKDGLVQGAHSVTDEVKHVAGEVAGEAKKAAESKLGAGKDFAAEHLGSVAKALRHTGDQLRTKESGVTEYVTMAADSVDKVSHYLQTRTLSQLMGDVEGYARREPAVFLGGTFFMGLLGGRFLKSATPHVATTRNGPSKTAGNRMAAQGNYLPLPRFEQEGGYRSEPMNARPAGSTGSPYGAPEHKMTATSGGHSDNARLGEDTSSSVRTGTSGASSATPSTSASPAPTSSGSGATRSPGAASQTSTTKPEESGGTRNGRTGAGAR